MGAIPIQTTTFIKPDFPHLLNGNNKCLCIRSLSIKVIHRDECTQCTESHGLCTFESLLPLCLAAVEGVHLSCGIEGVSPTLL